MAESPRKPVGLRITSDPDETKVEAPKMRRAKERFELPLRLVLASNLVPQTSQEPPRLVRVDKHTFAEVMRQFEPCLTLEVPNRLGDAPKTLEVELCFPRLSAFHPEAVARQVPALKRLLSLRTLVRRLRDGEIDLRAFRAEMRGAGLDEDRADTVFRALEASEDPAPSSPAPERTYSRTGRETPVDRLMRLVETGEEASETSGLLEALMQVAMGEDTSQPVATPAAEKLLADLDARLSAQTSVILNHPTVRRLETAWRGLKFLVDRIPFRKGIQLEVLCVSKTELNEVLHHQVLLPEHEGEGDKPPLSALVLDFAFGKSRRDLEQLHDLAEIGASLQVPLIGSASAAFFGVEKLSGLIRLAPLRQHLGGPEYVAWNKLRDARAARFLALVLPPFLLRPPYGTDAPVDAFPFEEADGLWGGGALAVAAALADSFARTGWPTHLEGHSLDDLPLWPGSVAHMPLAVLLPERRQRELAEAGFVVLSGRPNSDAIRIAHAPTIARPELKETEEGRAEARAHISLPCQLFVARAAAGLLEIQQALASGEALRDVQHYIEGRLRVFLQAEAEDAVVVEPVEEAGLPGQELLAVRLRPPRAVLDRDVSLVMGMQVATNDT